MRSSIIVIGAGGHAKVVVEILRATGHHVEYCVGLEGSSSRCLDVPVLYGNDHLLALRKDGYALAFPAIGSNFAREEVGKYALAIGFELVNAISPNSVISSSTIVGRGVAIMSGAVLNAESRVDDLAIVNTGATIDHDTHVSYGAHIAPQVALAGNVRIGRRALLGIGCVAIPGVCVGDDAVVGAGSVVISDVPDGVVAVGVPAKIVRGAKV